MSGWSKTDKRTHYAKGVILMAESVNEKVVLTERECAERLGISFWTLRQMRLQENAPHILLGHRIYYVYDTVVAWLSQQAVRGNAIRTS